MPADVVMEMIALEQARFGVLTHAAKSLLVRSYTAELAIICTGNSLCITSLIHFAMCNNGAHLTSGPSSCRMRSCPRPWTLLVLGICFTCAALG